MDGLHTSLGDDLSINLFLTIEDGLADAGDEDLVAELVVEGHVGSNREGHDTPVDAVRTIALRGILVADVAIATEHLLARSSLLAGRAVTGLVGEDARTERSIFGLCTYSSESLCDVLADLAIAAVEVFLLNALADADIFGHAARQSKLRELQRGGAIRRCLARRDELVSRGDGIVDDGSKFDEHILLHGIHLRPVLDIWTVAELGGEVLVAIAVVEAALINLGIVVIAGVVVLEVDVGSCCDDTTVGSGGSDGACVHQGHQRELTLTGLRTFAVGEVARGVADGEAVVGRHVAGTEARSTESGLDDHTSLEQFLGDVIAGGSQVDGR